MSFSFGVVNLFEFICLASLGGALSVCRAWQWFSERDWWVRANSVFLVLRTFPSVCGIQVLPGGEGKNPFSSSLCCKSTSVHVSAAESVFKTTSVFVLMEQMKTPIEAGSGGGCCRRCVWLTEDVNQPERCSGCWTILSLVAGQKSGGGGLLLVLEEERSWRRQMGKFLCVILGE